jgi:hypothetical protein
MGGSTTLLALGSGPAKTDLDFFFFFFLFQGVAEPPPMGMFPPQTSQGSPPFWPRRWLRIELPLIFLFFY